MDSWTSLILFLHAVLLLRCTSAGSRKQNDRCEYVQISDWSDCDYLTMTSTRSLELLSGNTAICDMSRVESRDCRKGHKDEIRMNDLLKRKLNKRKRVKGIKKNMYLQPDCNYKKGKWSSCSSQGVHTQTLIQTLVSGSALECQPLIVMSRSCLPKLEMAEAQELNIGIRKESKNRHEHKRTRKQKNKKKMELKKTRKRCITKSSELPHELSPSQELPLPHELPLQHELPVPYQPPPPAELHVEPQATFAIVSWLPPQHDASGDYVPVDSYKIGYGHGFPDLHTLQVNGQEVTYKLQNLDPGKDYIVSLRTMTRLGSSQPLYETIRTLSAIEASEQKMLQSTSVRSTVLSSEAINVTWVDISKSGGTSSMRREYYLRYRQLSHSSSENNFKILHTSDTFMIVSGLQPFTKYEVAVMVSDGERNSSWSAITSCVTQESAPSSAPGDLTVIKDPDNPKQIILSWQPPSKANGILTGYQVSYSTTSSQGQTLAESKNVKANQLSVTLKGLSPGLAYNFSVRAKNSQGMGPPVTVKDYYLTEDDADDEAVVSPRKLIVDVLSATSAVITWEDPGLLKTHEDTMASPVRTYTVRYRSLNMTPSNYTTVLSSLTSLYVADLMPLTWYEFMVKVHQGHQESVWSLPVKNKTFTAGKKLAASLPRPENLQVIVMSSNSALITWHVPDSVTRTDNKTEKSLRSYIYTLRYQDLGRKSEGYQFASLTLPSIFMVDLEPATSYEFSVRTDRGDLHSSWSLPVVNTTLESAPSTGPSRVTISMDDGDPTTAFLQWQPPEVPNGDITGYIVFYETGTERRSATVPAGQLTYRVPFLRPHTKYFFRIVAWNSQGFSPLSNRVVYRTPKVVGLPPTDVTVSPASDDKYNAIISWQPPSSNKKKIKFYTVTHFTEDGKQRTVLTVPGFTLSTIVKKLLPSTTYHFTVQAHYHHDSGPHSPEVKYSIPKEIH